MDTWNQTKRPWWRLHASTTLLIVLLGGISVLMQSTLYPAYRPNPFSYAKYRAGFRSSGQTGAWGWPYVYQYGYDPFSNAPLDKVRFEKLVLNCVLMCVAIAAVAALFEVWRRRRNSLWQWSLRDLGGLVLLCSLPLAWLNSWRNEHQRQVQMLHAMHPKTGYVQADDLADWEFRGPPAIQWLFYWGKVDWFDRIAGITVTPETLLNRQRHCQASSVSN